MAGFEIPAPFVGTIFKPVLAHEQRGLSERISANGKKRGHGELDEESLVTKPEDLKAMQTGYVHAFQTIGVPKPVKAGTELRTKRPMAFFDYDDDDIFADCAPIAPMPVVKDDGDEMFL